MALHQFGKRDVCGAQGLELLVVFRKFVIDVVVLGKHFASLSG